MWRETVARVWHWLTTSRYTRLLEDEVRRLRADNDGLLKALYPAIKHIRTEKEVRDQPADYKPIRF